MMAQLVYLLCALTSALCAGLLFRQYRLSRKPLLFWSTWCFACIAGNNVLLFVDRVLLPEQSVPYVRSSLTLVGMLMLIYGLIRERN